MRDKWRLQKTIEHHMYSRNPINLAFSVGNILRDVKKQREEKKAAITFGMKRTIEQIYDADQSMVPNWAMCQKKIPVNYNYIAMHWTLNKLTHTHTHTHIHHESKNTAQ